MVALGQGHSGCRLYPLGNHVLEYARFDTETFETGPDHF
jgi:hypothetical protein